MTGREVVVYVGLQLAEAKEGTRLAVRTLEDFFEKVCSHRGACRFYGKPDCPKLPHLVPRFSYVGPRFDAGMLT